MNLEEDQKRENRHIELLRALDRIAREIGSIAVALFLLAMLVVFSMCGTCR